MCFLPLIPTLSSIIQHTATTWIFLSIYLVMLVLSPKTFCVFLWLYKIKYEILIRFLLYFCGLSGRWWSLDEIPDDHISCILYSNHIIFLVYTYTMSIHIINISQPRLIILSSISTFFTHLQSFDMYSANSSFKFIWVMHETSKCSLGWYWRGLELESRNTSFIHTSLTALIIAYFLCLQYICISSRYSLSLNSLREGLMSDL